MPQNGFQSQHEKIPLGNYEPSMGRRKEGREGVREEEEEEKEEERRTFIKNHETSV